MVERILERLTEWMRRIFGSRNDRMLSEMLPVVDRVGSFEPEMMRLSDSQLRAKTDEFKGRFEKGETLEDLLPEAFAAVREAGRRTIGLRHFDVQLIGGIALHRGMISEMATGEGKTLVAPLAVYLNALEGKGVHVVTVNDYLARRDAQWMGPIYHALGLTVGAIQHAGAFVYDPDYLPDPEESLHNLAPVSKKEAYLADVTYGTNNEFGFDHLRDNMRVSMEDQVQRWHHFAIVDEVDSILIDEARTPLIISGPSEKLADEYRRADVIALSFRRKISKPDYDRMKTDPSGSDVERDYDIVVDEKDKSANYTESGFDKAIRAAGLEKEEARIRELEGQEVALEKELDAVEEEEARLELKRKIKQCEEEIEENQRTINMWLGPDGYITQGLRAHHLFKVDDEYVVKNGEVIIVDEFTGRLMPGRRWSDGLHQAIEAKHKVRIQEENQTLATITLQNYFKMYSKLAGMTGTAITEAAEFYKIYNLDVVVIPPNRPLIRHTVPDVILLEGNEKFRAAVEEIVEVHETGRPILVGTTSVEKSERVSEMLRRRGIKHEVLNAKHHEREAHIVAKAGQYGAVTISTNMAGRGTDIILGDGVAELGGLHVVGTERHEARRIDNQLRGRSGRQGDPGSSAFYVSLEDDLMRIFASERVKGIMQKLGLRGGDAIQHPMITNAIERAQKRVESHHFEIRKNLLDYDQVMNEQRKAVYGRRQEILKGENLKGRILEMIEGVVSDAVGTHMNPDTPKDQWNPEGLAKWFHKRFKTSVSDSELDGSPDDVEERLVARVKDAYEAREKEVGPELMRKIERYLLLTKIDEKWKDHLHNMDVLKSGIGLRSYAQVDPKVEYKREAFDMFSAMVDSIHDEVSDLILRVRVDERAEERDIWKPSEFQKRSYGQFEAASQKEEKAPEAPRQIVRTHKKVGRNDPCPCGSGKKYKKCCGAGRREP